MHTIQAAGSGPRRGQLLFCMLILLGWRLAVGGAGVVGAGLLPQGRFTHFSLVHALHWPTNPLTLAVDAGVRNDALWYARIAQHGYTYSAHHPSSIAFYPLYPALIKVTSFVVAGDVYLAGLIVSTICMCLCVPLLHAWLSGRGYGDRTAATVLFLLLCPWALFFAAMYSEAVFLMLAIGAFLFYEREQWARAAACVLLISLSRPTGVIVVPGLLCLLIQYRRHRLPGPWLPILACPLALGAFAAYQQARFGTPFASMRAATVPPWSRGLSQALQDVTLHARPGFPSWYFVLMVSVGIGLLALIPLVYRRFGAAYALFAALAVLGPAASGLISLERYAIVDFPVFAALGCTLSGKARFAALVFSAYFLLFFASAFAAGWAIF